MLETRGAVKGNAGLCSSLRRWRDDRQGPEKEIKEIIPDQHSNCTTSLRGSDDTQQMGDYRKVQAHIGRWRSEGPSSESGRRIIFFEWQPQGPGITPYNKGDG